MPSILEFSARKISELLERAQSLAEDATEGTYSPPSDAPLEWARAGLDRGVVTVEAATMCAHLIAGTVCQRHVPFILRYRLDLTIIAVEAWVTKTMTRRGMPRWGTWVVPVLNEIAAIWGGGAIEAAIEQAVRKTALARREELLAFRLGKDKPRVVVTSRVYTRNPGEPQRKKNRSWRDRKPGKRTR